MPSEDIKKRIAKKPKTEAFFACASDLTGSLRDNRAETSGVSSMEGPQPSNAVLNGINVASAPQGIPADAENIENGTGILSPQLQTKLVGHMTRKPKRFARRPTGFEFHSYLEVV